jgi:hypothetical protein
MFIFFYFTGFFSLIIFSLYKHNIYLYKALITLLISIIIIISITEGVGGDLENYERHFYGIRIGDIELSRWGIDRFKILIKWIFNETTYEGMPLKSEENYFVSMQIYNQIDHYGFKFYQIITNLVYIAGAFSFVNSISYRNNNTTKFLILLLPVSMTFMTISIEQSLSLGIVFFALSRIQKNKLGFLLLFILSCFIHWSSWMFLPLVFYDRRFFIIFLTLSLTFVLILEIFNVSVVNLVITTFTIFNDGLGTNIFNIFIENLRAQGKYERFISWHHIYLSTFFVFCVVVFHMKFRSSLNVKNRKDSILLLSTLIWLLTVSFIFKEIDVYVVRIGAAIKIFSLIYFVNAVYILNIYTRVINILLGLSFTLLGAYSFY